MIIGVPKESRHHEHRVGLTPNAAAKLVERGHTVVVQKDAGMEARYTDREYEKAGAHIVYSADEAYKRADVVAQVGSLSNAEVDLLNPGSTVCAFHHLAVLPQDVVTGLMERHVTAIAYELIEDAFGSRPVLTPFSEMAGNMALQIGAHYLQNDPGGRGILLANVPGITPPTVVILGAGTAGRTAACRAVAAGAHVVVLDTDMAKLRKVSAVCGGHAQTANVNLEPLDKYVRIADLLIGAVLIPGAKAPILVTEEMVRSMRPGSVIVDLSIDQGGCVETSRPTTPEHPAFVAHGVVHYCVPNMTANVARTASKALARAVLPQLTALTDGGIRTAIVNDPELAAGVVIYEGALVKSRIAETHHLPYVDLAEALGGGNA